MRSTRWSASRWCRSNGPRPTCVTPRWRPSGSSPRSASPRTRAPRRYATDTQSEPIVWAYADLAQIATFEGDVEASLELLRTGAAHPADRRDRVNLAYLILVGGAVGQQLPEDELAEAMSQINATGFPMAI